MYSTNRNIQIVVFTMWYNTHRHKRHEDYDKQSIAMLRQLLECIRTMPCLVFVGKPKINTIPIVCQNIHSYTCVYFNMAGASVFLFAGLLRILWLE